MSTDSKEKEIPIALEQPKQGREAPAAEVSGPQGGPPETPGKAGAEASGVEGAKGGEGAEVDALRKRLAEAEAEAKKNFDLYLRERAELENFKKRTRREVAESIQLANESLIRDLLPVLDNLERAVRHAESGGDGVPLAEGVSLVLRAFEETLRRYGVTAIDAGPGTAFDPNVHEAVASEIGEGEPNSIVRQHERGFLLHGRLLRPAKVVVAAGKPRESDGVEKERDRD